METKELVEVLETLKAKDLLKEKTIIDYKLFLEILDVINKNLKEKFHHRIKTEMVK